MVRTWVKPPLIIGLLVKEKIIVQQQSFKRNLVVAFCRLVKKPFLLSQGKFCPYLRAIYNDNEVNDGLRFFSSLENLDLRCCMLLCFDSDCDSFVEHIFMTIWSKASCNKGFYLGFIFLCELIFFFSKKLNLKLIIKHQLINTFSYLIILRTENSRERFDVLDHLAFNK